MGITKCSLVFDLTTERKTERKLCKKKTDF